MEKKFEAQDIGYVKAKGIVESKFGGQQLKLSLGGGKTQFPLVQIYLDIDKMMNVINNPDEVFAEGADFKLASLGKCNKLIVNGMGGGSAPTYNKPQARQEYRKPATGGYQKRTGNEFDNPEVSPY